MVNKNDILAMLRDGKSPEDIGNAFADMLNDANAEYQAEISKNQKEQNKLYDLSSIIEDFLCWYETYYEDVEDQDPEEMAKAVIDSIDMIRDLAELLQIVDAPKSSAKAPVPKVGKASYQKAEVKGNSFEDLLRSFISG